MPGGAGQAVVPLPFGLGHPAAHGAEYVQGPAVTGCGLLQLSVAPVLQGDKIAGVFLQLVLQRAVVLGQHLLSGLQRVDLLFPEAQLVGQAEAGRLRAGVQRGEPLVVRHRDRQVLGGEECLECFVELGRWQALTVPVARERGRVHVHSPGRLGAGVPREER